MHTRTPRVTAHNQVCKQHQTNAVSEAALESYIISCGQRGCGSVLSRHPIYDTSRVKQDKSMGFITRELSRKICDDYGAHCERFLCAPVHVIRVVPWCEAWLPIVVNVQPVLTGGLMGNTLMAAIRGIRTSPPRPGHVDRK